MGGEQEFAAENASAVAAFAKTMDEANAAYLADPEAAWTADSEPVKTIAAATGADVTQVPDILQGFAFIPLKDQLSHTAWWSSREDEGYVGFLGEGGAH